MDCNRRSGFNSISFTSNLRIYYHAIRNFVSAFSRLWTRYFIYGSLWRLEMGSSVTLLHPVDGHPHYTGIYTRIWCHQRQPSARLLHPDRDWNHYHYLSAKSSIVFTVQLEGRQMGNGDSSRSNSLKTS